jgi:hypothetical protein
MRTIMLLSVALASAFAFVARVPSAHAQTAPEWVRILKADGSGSGCPPGSISTVISPDLLSLTVKFSSFDARVGPNAGPNSLPSKSCTMSVLLDFPAGWSYSLITADYLGRADLGEDTVGEQTSTYWFQGFLPSGEEFRTTLTGPFFSAYSRRDELPVGARVWSPCGLRRNLNIDADVSVSNTANASSNAFMNVKIAEFTNQVTYGITWRKCP